MTASLDTPSRGTSSTGAHAISRRVGAVAESATLAIDARAKALRAAGEDVISFGAGEPDFPTPEPIVDAAVAACRDPRNHRYTPTAGLPELREAIATKTARDSGLAVEASQVLVTNGAKHAVFQAFATLLDPGDEVLVMAPYWTTYPETITLAGGVPVVVGADESTGFRVGVDELDAACTPRTKVLLFVSPSNPTGAVYPAQEIEAIGGWAAERGLWVVTDEIYEHLVYGGRTHHSLPVVAPDAAERCIVINGVSKTYAMTGWRVGWMIGPKEVVQATINLQSQETSNVADVCQRAALAAVSGDLSAMSAMRQVFDRRRRLLHSGLNSIPGVSCLEPEGAFYAFPSVAGLLGRSIRGHRVDSSLDLAAVLLDEARVAVVPGEAFGSAGYARLSYALADDQLTEGVRRLTEVLGEAEVPGEAGASRILVTEPIAEAGIEILRAAGNEVDVRIGLSPAELQQTVAGANALIVRSATTVDADVLAASSDLVVVGRAGIGVDNVDVAAATRRGVMVVNAPQSNILSAAEHTMALLLAQARNVPQAHAALTRGKWERSRWEGVELHGKTLGVIGLGRVGALVAQRAHAFGMRLCAYDPYVSSERARQMGVTLTSLEDVMARSDFVTVHLPKTPETLGLIGKDLLAAAKPGLRIINTARGGIIDEDALAEAVRSGQIAGAGIDVFATEPATSSPLFELDPVVVTPHLAASTREAQDKAGVTIAEQVLLALAGDFVPLAVNVGAAEASETVRPFLPLAERLGRIFASLNEGLPDRLDVEYQGTLAGYDTRILTLSILKGLFAAGTEEPVSYVNAPQLAEERGLEVRESKTTSARDFVNLITLRAPDHAVAGTLAGVRAEPRIVMVDDHVVEVPPARHMLVVRNDDRPGMIGVVGLALGEAQVSISSMAVGPSANASTALMVLSTDRPTPSDVLERLARADGILDIHSVTSG